MSADADDFGKDNLEVLRRFDYLLRTKGIKSVLFASEYRGEGHFETAIELARLLRETYRLSVSTLDLREDAPGSGSDARRQSLSELSWLFERDTTTGREEVNRRELDAHIKTLRESNDAVFVIHDVKRVPANNFLYETDFDAAVLTRAKSSVGPGKSRRVTDLILDANIPLLGIVFNKV